MKAQRLEKEGKFEKAVNIYFDAYENFRQAHMFTSFFDDKHYQIEAKILMKAVDKQIINAKQKIYDREISGGITH